MNVLYVAPDVVVPFYRGASTHVLEVAKGLARAGDRVHVLTRRLDSSQPEVESIGGITVHRIYRGIVRPLPGSRYSQVGRGGAEDEGLVSSAYRAYLSTVFPLFAGFVSADLVRRYRVQVILERETAFGAGAIASQRSGIPLVLEVVGPRYSKKSVAVAKKILAYTSAMVPGIDSSRVVFVDAGVDSDRFSPNPRAGEEVRSRLGLRTNDLVVGYVGTFQPWHGLDSLLNALGSLVLEFPNLKALLVGPYFGDAQKEADSLGLSGNCIFTGPVDYEKVPDYINACDVMAAPYDPRRSELRSSRGIGFPIKVLEYMACAKPVVTTDIEPTNGIPGIRRAAVLIPPGNPSELARTLAGLVRDLDWSRAMGQNGRALVEDGYSWSEFARNLHTILEKASEQA